MIGISKAIYLGEASYRLGCVEAHKKFNQVAGSNDYCAKKAKEHLQENILSIMNSGPVAP